MGVRAAWVLLPLLVSVVTAGPPTPAVTKRSVEDIQFGNQQNLPIGLLDDNALPGAFPSSETSEEAVEKQGTKKEEKEKDTEEKKDELEKAERKVAGGGGVGGGGGTQEQQQQQQQQQEEEEEEERERRAEENEGGVMEESRWHNPALPTLRYYRPHWGVPRLYTSAGLPLRRRRRSPRLPPPLRPKPSHNHHRTLASLRTLMRARGETEPGRQKREADLEQLLKEVDVVELLNLLTRPPPPPPPQPQTPHHFYRTGGGFGTVRYAPAPARYAPQPKLFPDYEEGEGGGEGGQVGGMGLLKQNVRATTHQLPEAVMVSAGGGRRMWRRSGGGVGLGGYGLSAVPGFKRSAFRSNNPPQPQLQPLSPGDVYSLAAMLGAELDPVTHRLRRAAM